MYVCIYIYIYIRLCVYVCRVNSYPLTPSLPFVLSGAIFSL